MHLSVKGGIYIKFFFILAKASRQEDGRRVADVRIPRQPLAPAAAINQ